MCSPLYTTARAALEFGEQAIRSGTFSRGDYKELCELVVFYLCGEITNFSLHQPGACHEARFTADALYLLKLTMTSKMSKVMNEEEKTMVETASFFVVICYTPWFLKAYLTSNAPNNDLNAFKEVFHIKEQYPELGHALLKSMQRHTWYLTEELVLLALADVNLDYEVKIKMLKRLLEFDVSKKFKVSKPQLPTLQESTELFDLVGPQSWVLLKVADIDTTELESWVEDQNTPSLESFISFVKNSMWVNDCAERNIRLIQNFVNSHKSEDMNQNVMLVARDNRKNPKKEMTKKQLKTV